MNNCRYCKKEIELNHPQVGGVHMYCETAYFSELTEKVIKIELDGG